MSIKITDVNMQDYMNFDKDDIKMMENKLVELFSDYTKLEIILLKSIANYFYNKNVEFDKINSLMINLPLNIYVELIYAHFKYLKNLDDKPILNLIPVYIDKIYQKVMELEKNE